MIKLLEENKAVILATCPNCLSKFTLEDNDIIYLYNRSDTRGVICPICGEKVTTCEMKNVTERKIKEMLKGDSNENN